MTQQINGMFIEKLINCDTHFDNDQIEAIMKVLEDSGYSDMYEALKSVVEMQSTPQDERTNAKEVWTFVVAALAKAEI